MFVYKTEDGKYLQYSSRVGHTGMRTFINWTDNINAASVLHWEDAKMRRDLAPYSLLRVEVEETRTVKEIQT